MNRLSDLPGLGARSEAMLLEVGIKTEEELRSLGAVRAFIRLKKEGRVNPSLNFLYALVGALEGENWLKIAKSEKARLLMALDDYKELEAMLKLDNETF